MSEKEWEDYGLDEVLTTAPKPNLQLPQLKSDQNMELCLGAKQVETHIALDSVVVTDDDLVHGEHVSIVADASMSNDGGFEAVCSRG